MADNDEQKPSINWGPRRRVWAALSDELRAQKDAVASQAAASDTSIQKAAARLARLDRARAIHEDYLTRAPKAVVEAQKRLGQAKDVAVEFASLFGWDRDIILNPSLDLDGQNRSDAATRAFGPLNKRPGPAGIRNYFDDAEFSANVSFTADVPSTSMATSSPDHGQNDDGEQRYVERHSGGLKPVTEWRSDFHDRSAAAHRNKLIDMLDESTLDPSPAELDRIRSAEPGVEVAQPKKIQLINDLFAHLNVEARSRMEKDHEALRKAAGLPPRSAGAAESAQAPGAAAADSGRNVAERLQDAMAQSVEKRIETEAQLFDYFEQCARRGLDEQFATRYFSADQAEQRDAWLQSNSKQPQMPEALRERFVAELEHIADGSSAYKPALQTHERAAFNDAMLDIARANKSVAEAAEFATDVEEDFATFSSTADKNRAQLDGLTRLDSTAPSRIAAVRNDVAKEGAAKPDAAKPAAPAVRLPASQSDWLTGYTSSALEDALSAQRSKRLASVADASTSESQEQPVETAPAAAPAPAPAPAVESEPRAEATPAPSEAPAEASTLRAARGWPTNASVASAGPSATSAPLTRWGAPLASAKAAAPSTTPAPSQTDGDPAMAQTDPLARPAAAEHAASATVEVANHAPKTALPSAWAQQATAAEAAEQAPAPAATESNPMADSSLDSGSLAQPSVGIDTQEAALSGIGGLRDRLAAQKAGAKAAVGPQGEGEGRQSQGAAALVDIDTPQAALSGVGGLRDRLAAQRAGAKAAAGPQGEGEGKQSQGAAAQADIDTPQAALSGMGGLRDRLAAQKSDAKTSMQSTHPTHPAHPAHPKPKQTDGGPAMAQKEPLAEATGQAASTSVEAANPAPKTAMPWMQATAAKAPERAPAPAANAANPMAAGSWIDSVALAQAAADTDKPQETLSGLGGLQARRAAQEAGAKTASAAQGEGEGKQSQGAAAAPAGATPQDTVARAPAPHSAARPSPAPGVESLNAIAARLKDDPEADPQLRKDASAFEKLRGNMVGPKGEVIMGVDATIAKVERDKKAHEASPHHAAMQEKHAAGQNLGRDELAELAKNPYAGSVLAHPNLAQYRGEMGLSEREVGKSTFDTEITQCVTTDNVKTKGLAAQSGNSRPLDAEQIHASLQGAAGDWLAQRRALRAAAASTTEGQQPTEAQKQKRGFSI
ncbi:hypothetical protein BX589_10149 [Paraburkholderia fungorum]|nr:hypothetical protein BX589_10149 [Paraburkholderia fungorum]